MQFEISPDVAQKLGNYVYAYIDPRDNSIFYIGKGVGARATSHLNDKTETEKVRRIKSIRDAGQEPRIDIVAHQLRDDREASCVEAALIEVIGVHGLTNKIRGVGSIEFPRRPLADLVMECAPRKVVIDDPCLLIRINQSFEYGMSPEALYEATRGIWRIGERRERAQYVMAVYAGVVREVYEVECWDEACTNPYNTRDNRKLKRIRKGRWEFVGRVASQNIRNKYLGATVAHLFRHGQQNPVAEAALQQRRVTMRCSRHVLSQTARSTSRAKRNGK